MIGNCLGTERSKNDQPPSPNKNKGTQISCVPFFMRRNSLECVGILWTGPEFPGLRQCDWVSERGFASDCSSTQIALPQSSRLCCSLQKRCAALPQVSMSVGRPLPCRTNQVAPILRWVARSSASNVRVPGGAAAKVELHRAGQSARGCDRSGTARDARCFTATISERVALTTTPDFI